MARATKTFTADGSGAMDALTTVGVVYNKVTFYEDARRATLDYRIASPLITSPKIIKLAGEKAEIEVPVMNGKKIPFFEEQIIGYIETGTYDSDTDVFTLSGSTRFAQEED